MVNKTPKPFKYTLLYNDGVEDIEYELLDDPMGWSEQNITFSRSVDFGLDTEYVVPLSFTGEAFNILKSIFETSGAFSLVKLRIDKRNNDWTFNQFYLYRLDFRTYKNNFESIELEGIDDSLLSKIKAYSDTEYEIDIPTANKLLLTYEGITINKKNLIQCGYGKLTNYADITDVNHASFLLSGKRSVRTYTENFQFTDENGLPFETMTFKCVKAITFDLVYDFHVKIKQTLGIEDSGTIKIIKHDSNFDNATVIDSFAVDSTDLTLISRTDTFIASGTKNITLSANDYVSVFYIVDYNALMSVQITDGYDCFISIQADADSQFTDSVVEMFTFEWLIRQLLLKIDSTAELNFYVSDLDYIPLIGCTQTIRNLGKTDGTGKFKAKLKDLLKALNYSYCVSVDISGNLMTIYDRADTYTSFDKGELVSNNIIVEFDDKHCYNKIKVGGKTKDEYKNSVYPFNCLKSFTIPDSLADNEYDLEHPFEIDCYSIEEMFEEVINSSKSDNTDNTDFFVIACKKVGNPALFEANGVGYDNRRDYIEFKTTKTYEGYLTDDGEPANSFCVEFATLPTGFDIVPEHTVQFTPTETNDIDVTFDYSVEVTQTNYIRVKVIPYGCTYEILSEVVEYGDYIVGKVVYRLSVEQSVPCQFDLIVTNIDEESDGTFVYVNSFDITLKEIEGYQIYKDSTILDGFDGDATSIYNLSLSPKRALLKHLPYISISAYGSANDIEFTSSDRVSALVSKLDYETSPVTENNDVTPVTPLFLPVKLTFDTQKEYNNIYDMTDNKYGYYTITEQKSNKQLQGWINKSIFAVSKRKQQSWELQAKTI